MEWYYALFIIFGSLLILMFIGMPVAFAFLTVALLGMFILFNGVQGLLMFIPFLRESVGSFILLPVVFFILMGDLAFRAGIAPALIDALDKWIGRLPGRLSLLAVASGTLFATMTGTSIASVAMLGASLLPEMEKRGYKSLLALGPIMGSGGLAMMIPPSGLAVLLGAMASVSIGKLLVGIIMPGLLMAILYALYVIIVARLWPDFAPNYETASVPLSVKLISTTKYILPLGFIIFLVIGVMLLGIATPSEAAATGCLATFILAACYKKLNFGVVKLAMVSTLTVTGLMLLIVAGAKTYGIILARSGAMSSLIEVALASNLSPIALFIIMQVIVFIMGMFMGPVPIMMITLPLFMPIVVQTQLDPLWYCILLLLNLETGLITPPFGMSLFVMKGAAPRETTMNDIIVSVLPFVALNVIVFVLIAFFPEIALWLPSIVK